MDRRTAPRARGRRVHFRTEDHRYRGLEREESEAGDGRGKNLGVVLMGSTTPSSYSSSRFRVQVLYRGARR